MTFPDSDAVSLAELVAPLSDMLGPVPTGPHGDATVTTVELWECESQPPPAGALILAVGLTAGSRAAEDLLATAHAAGAVGVVFGGQDDGGSPHSSLHGPEESEGSEWPAVLQRSRWVSWSELFVQLRRELSSRRAPEASPATGYRSLTQLANTLATMTGAAITVEDLDSRVLAYSTVDGPVDSLRQETILGQRVPRWRVDELRRSGFLSELWASTGVIHRPADGERPSRLVIAVRNADEVFGSIWAAETGAPFSPAAEEALRLAAQVAIPLVIEAARAGDTRERARQAALHALCTGEGSASESARVLSLPAQQASRVLMCRLTGTPDPRRDDALLLRLLAELPGSVSDTHDGTLRVLAPVPPEDSDDALLGRLRVALTGSAPPGETLFVAVGHTVSHLAEAHRSAEDARLVLRALTEAGPRGAEGLRLAVRADVADEVSVHLLVDQIAHDPVPFTRRIDTLREYDREHDASLTRTLAIYLRTHGSIAETARRMHLHSNSLRYRLQRLSELSGIDVTDPQSRLVTELGLRVLGLFGDEPSPAVGS